MKTLMGIFFRMVIYGVLGLVLSQAPLAVTGGKPFKDENAMATGALFGAVLGFGHGVRKSWKRSNPA